MEPRMRRLKSQVLLGSIFRKLIAAHREDQQRKNQRTPLESRHDS